ncbi:hypothetical protein [Aurantiacibacter suaedae]|uniref:hypothetical protein n=1 Tax=Aurantiacibacter suaedae TaxID=2545755 RepID=UPI0010F6C6A9|nr:hypothetical protein [Aurantiacibacter suaedae]
MVSANSPQPDASEASAPPRNAREREASRADEQPNRALADDGGSTLQSERPATAVVRADSEKQPELVGSQSPDEKQPHLRLPVAGDLPDGGKGLPVAGEGEADPALALDIDIGEVPEGEGELAPEVVSLVAEVDVAIVAPAAPLVKDQVQAPVIAKTPVDANLALADGEEAAGSGDGAETPASPAPLRHDAAPRPNELEQLRGGRAQGLAWEQAQQTILAPARQANSATAKPALGEVALAPEAGKDAREGASTAQLLAGAGENSDLKSLKELREARLAAAPAAAAAAKVPAAEPSSSPFADAGSAVRGVSAPVHPTGAAPTSPTDTSLAQLVDRLIETRVAARSERSHMELSHPDFGRVTLAVGLRGDDRLSIDLPGAPTELRHAVGQALAQAGAAQSSGQNAGQQGGQNTGNTGNQSSNQRSDGQGQAALAGGETSQNSAGHNGGSGKNTYEPDNPQLSIFAQSQTAASDRGAGRPAGGPESTGRRGVLA